MSRCKSVVLVLLLLISSLSGMAFSFDKNDTDEGQKLGGPGELNLLQHQSMQNVQGAWSGGGSGSDVGYGIAVDSSGNAYVAGSFYGTATFGNTNLTSNGSSDIFIAKLSSSGSWQWAVRAGSSGFDESLGIAVDSSGNTYVTGRFVGTSNFGSINLTSSGNYDIFIAKLSSSGSWQWAVKAGGGSGNDIGYGIAVDSSGNAYVTGKFEGTATFGSTSLTNSGAGDIFVAKISSSGSWQWAVKAVGLSTEEGYGIAVDSSGYVFITGRFLQSATFGSTNLTSSGSYDIFIAKLNSSGSWQWAVKAGGSNQDNGRGIAVDSSGNAYVTGNFQGTATFGNTSLTSSGYSAIFIAKLSSSGSWQWAVKAGGSGNTAEGLGIAVDSSGNTYATGVFQLTATFGSTSLTSSGYSDIFIAKLSSSGLWQWAVKAGGSAYDAVNGIAVDSDGFVHLTGAFSDTGFFRGDSLTSAGGYDIFVWRTFPGPIISSVSPDDSHPDGNVTATITGDSFQFLNQTFSKNITVTNSGNSTLNNHVITVEDPFFNESGLVGSWHFDESSGTVVDTSGNGNNATAYGGPTYGAVGVDATAIEFDGTNDYLRVPDADSLDFGLDNFSVSVWVKMNDLTGTQEFVRKDPAGNALILQYQPNYGKSLLGWSGTSFVKFDGNSDGYTPVVGQWDHVVFTREVNPSNFSLSLYLNGEMVKKVWSSAFTSQNLTTTGDLGIGAQIRTSSVNSYFDGSLDELKIYNRALSDAEILSQYQHSSGDAMRNYWDVSFVDSTGNALPHTMPYDGEFQIEIPQIPANSSIDITIEYGQEILTNPNINTTNQSSDMSNLSISIGSATTNLGVTFGNTASNYVEYIDENTINVTVPAHAIGAVNLTITDSSGYSHTLVDGFTYYGISSLSPNFGNISGGDNVTVTGAGFDDFTHYRTPITVSNPTTSTISNSAVNISLPLYNESDLSASWHFDEASGTIIDSGGHGNNATVYGNPTYGVDGIDALAMNFDGVDDAIMVDDDDSLDMGTSDFTISFWIKIDEADYTNQIIFRKGDTSFSLVQYSDTKWTAYAGSTANTLTFNQAPVENEWTHIVFRRESNYGGNSNQIQLSFSINGVEEKTQVYLTAPFDISNSEELVIGGSKSNSGSAPSGNWINASLDELKFHKRFMSDSEVTSLYEGGIAMRNYWDVQFRNETGEVLNHSMDSDGTFQVEIPSISASSSQIVYAEYGRTVSSSSFTTVPSVSASLTAAVGTEDANAVDLSLGGVVQPSATMINSTTLQFTTVPHAGGFTNLSISDGSKSFTLTNAFRFSDCISGNSTQDRWGCPDTDGDGYSDPDPTGISGPVWDISDGADNCVSISNVNQSDYENDLIGDMCDSDDDNDTVADVDDECQYGAINWTSSGSTDIDSDGCQDTIEDTPLVSYPNATYDFRSNLSIVSLNLSNAGTNTSNFSISPDISPLNLSFNSNTGEISGIPNSSRITVNYTIWANNSFGNNYTNLMISVGEPIPTNIQYPSLNPVFTVDVSLGSGWSATASGGIVNSWAIQPLSDLTAINLSFDTSTGTISGTPSGNMSLTTFMVSAGNLAGTSYANISITVVHSLEPISYSGDENLTVGSSATILTSESGNNITHWAIQPLAELTAVNLSFNTSTGTISGTPSGNMSITRFMVSATNDNGTVYTNISIVVVNPLDPVSYSGNENLTVGSLATILPSESGNNTAQWAIQPLSNLTAINLSFNPSTGAISGIPSGNMSITTFMVSATNDNGTEYTNISIVVVNPVTEISYNTIHYNATEGVYFDLIPVMNGTEVDSWTMERQDGLTDFSGYFAINSTTGIISGIPAQNLPNNSYIVYAENDGGITQFNISIEILLDTDSDGVADVFDDFSNEPTQTSDTDSDGYGDNLSGVLGDVCPSEWGNSTQDRFGCIDTDGDGWSDEGDSFAEIFSQWNDTDNDGYGDNQVEGAEHIDWFIDNPTQWNDTDGDGWGDNYNLSLEDGRNSSWPGILNNSATQIDYFPLESSQWHDTDDDGYGDNQSGYQADACPEVSGNSTIPVYGCIDSDGDGVSDDDDDYPTDPLRNRDTDGDDFDDGVDDCWNTPGNSTVDRTGCVDSDGDGWSDSGDDLQNDSTQWNDADGDGFGDNQLGDQPDACIEFYGNSTIDRWGCLDTDGDGVSDPDDNGDYGPVWTLLDGADAFYDNASATGDVDGDGFDNGIDDCLTISGNSTGFFSVDSTTGGKKGCPDSDGDGWADIEDEEPIDAQQIIDTTPPPISTIWNVVDEDENGKVVLVELSHSGSDWDVLGDSDKPVSIQVRYSTTAISDCSGVLVNGPTEDVSQSTRPPSVIRLENLTNEQEYHVCLFISDVRGNEFILGPNNATPTRNENPVYDGGLTNEIAYIGELWYLNLCDYFSDEETPCEELEVSSSTNRLGINSVNKSVSWRPTGTDASIMNITFTVCDSGLIPLCLTSNPINIGVEKQPESPDGGGESEGYIVDIPFFGETEVSMDSIAGIVGSALLGIVTVLVTVLKFRRSRSGKKRVSQIIKEVRITKNTDILDDLLDDATRLYTKDRINTEDFSLIDGHIEKRKVVLMRELVVPPPLSPPRTSPSIDAKGEVRPDGYEWLERPLGNGVWWYRTPGSESWSKWED